jgi:hypothetical protein
MSKFATFEDGFPTGFYDPAIHGEAIPSDAVEITDYQWLEFLDNPGLRKWDGSGVVTYDPPPPSPVVPERVTARQFKLQLLAAGLLDQVEAWVASQDQAVQIAYANSGTFLRTEPMMQTGFQALGFTAAQIDAFYVAAAAL